MPTTREALEASVADMRRFADDLDSRGAMTDDERRRLDEKQEKVTKLTAVLRRQAGEHLTVNPSLSESLDYIKRLSGDSGSTRFDSIIGTSGRSAVSSANVVKGKVDSDLASFNFSPDELKELHTGAVDRRIVAKAAITSVTAPMAQIPDYRPEVFPWLRDKQRILDLIPKQVTNAPTVHYFQGTAAANAAAPVAQGANKPESEPAWEQKTAQVRKLAHYTRINDEVIWDYDGFLNVVGNEMVAGLIDEENSQLVAGDGTGQNLLGLIAEPNVLTAASVATDLDAIVAAFAALRTGAAHCEPDVIVMHPNDWYSTGFLLAKETGSGAYMLGNPTSGALLQLWGVPVILTESMTENTAMVASLKTAATAYVRQPPTVEVAPASGAEFIANQTLVRSEERLALAIHHPKAICLVGAV